MCVEHISSPLDHAKRKVEHIYTGPSDSDLAEEMMQCESEVRLRDTRLNGIDMARNLKIIFLLFSNPYH